MVPTLSARYFWLVALVVLVGTGVGCARKSTVAQSPPAKVDNPRKESELTTVTLTSEAEKRLGIQVATVDRESVMRTQTFSGEVLLPPDSTFTVSAPITGTLQAVDRSGRAPTFGTSVKKGETIFRLIPYVTPTEKEQRELTERDTEIAVSTAENDVKSAVTRLEAARVRAERAEQLVRDGGGSVKAAQAELEQVRLAEVALQAAREKLALARKVRPQKIEPVPILVPQAAFIQTVHVAPGQTVAAGTTLVDAANYQRVHIRVPVYVGDLKLIPVGQNATVHGLTETPGSPGRTAVPVAAPPSADPNAATADLYFELSNADLSLRPGQRVGVTLRLRASEEGLTVPWSAVLHDVDGGTWVYEQTSEHHYVRRRVAVRRVDGNVAILSQGPAAGAKVVTQGASELFGTEFGAGK